MKARLTAILVALGLGVGSAAAADERIVFVGHWPPSDPFFVVVKNGAEAAAEDLGVELSFSNPASGELAQQARLIEQAVASRPDGIITTISDYDVISDAVRNATRRGIDVVTANSGTAEQSGDLGALLHVGQPEYVAGKAAGERAKAAGVSSFLCVNHFIAHPASVARCQGFADGLGVELGEQMIDSGTDPREVSSKVQAYLRNNPDTEAVLALGPASASPTIAALKDSGLAGDIFLASFDLSDDIVAAIENGTMDLAVDQQPFLQGYIPVQAIALHQRYGLLQANNVNSGPGIVTAENVELVKRHAGETR